MPVENDREAMRKKLDELKARLARCMGGTDPKSAIAAAREIVAIRNQLRDDAALLKHLQKVLHEPAPATRLRRRP